MLGGSYGALENYHGHPFYRRGAPTELRRNHPVSSNRITLDLIGSIGAAYEPPRRSILFIAIELPLILTGSIGAAYEPLRRSILFLAIDRSRLRTAPEEHPVSSNRITIDFHRLHRSRLRTKRMANTKIIFGF
jgi:hypothetical protein